MVKSKGFTWVPETTRTWVFLSIRGVGMEVRVTLEQTTLFLVKSSKSQVQGQRYVQLERVDPGEPSDVGFDEKADIFLTGSEDGERLWAKTQHIKIMEIFWFPRGNEGKKDEIVLWSRRVVHFIVLLNPGEVDRFHFLRIFIIQGFSRNSFLWIITVASLNEIVEERNFIFVERRNRSGRFFLVLDSSSFLTVQVENELRLLVLFSLSWSLSLHHER